MKKLKIIIITGHSGSGKSTAISAFEDAGFYCVDNMPVALLPKFLELPIESDFEIAGLAFVMDLREKSFLSMYSLVFDSLKKKGYQFKILFLEADEETLLKRYSQTRRHHPLSKDKSLLEGIRIEQEQLKDLKISADKIIDTSRYNVHNLKSVINYIAQQSKSFAPMKINILSFGFKYGTPHDASLIMDVRFLANPYFVPELKALNGKSADIKNYVLNNDEARRFFKKYLDLLDYLIPLYEKEGKSYLTIAVGCTGGRHRSVSITEAIFEHIKKPGRQIIITHRDINL
ncbi:MAG: RNase adapter protein RapZ [Desulfobacteraceae bacterium Eth-SRB2]|nr:MAG: RNase adapter protein RapZ [Desulfobacteraceae bacterium Eth-SRB2]